MDKVVNHSPRVRRWLEFRISYQYAVTNRKGVSNGNADMLSRLPLPATEQDCSGKTSIYPPDPARVYLSRSCGLQTFDSPTPGVGLGRLVRPAADVRWDTLPSVAEDLASEDFQDFRPHGPRMMVDKLFASDWRSVARASHAVFTVSASSAAVTV